MTKPVNNATELKPVVERAVKALYGSTMQNVKILKADQFPLFKEPKQGWLVHAEFNDDRTSHQGDRAASGSGTEVDNSCRENAELTI